MDFALSEEQQAIFDMAHGFGQDHIAPHARAWEEAAEIPKSLWPRVAELGLGGVYVSEDHGGSGLSRLDATLVFEALAMAGDMTIYGIRNNVKLIREDCNGQRNVISLNLNEQNILHSPYYYMQQNDILYIAPNKTKAKSASVSNSTTIWVSVITSLVSLASLIVNIVR